MTSPRANSSTSSELSYKVGFPVGTPLDEAERVAEERLREFAAETNRTFTVETLSRESTPEHEAAGEFLLVIHGRWTGGGVT